jgi:pyroglutamyl-peptidase
MPATILLTGFGPFPGAPRNPTGPLVRALVRRSQGGFRTGRLVAHVFHTSYQAVDRELPALIARERPRAILMFGLARRIRTIRIETRARNALSATLRDASGRLPAARAIAPGKADALALRAPAVRFLSAVRAAGICGSLSRDAGRYLCNYLCWRASEAAARAGGPRLVAFVHVPEVLMRGVHARRRSSRSQYPQRARTPRTLADLIAAGAAIVQAADAAARLRVDHDLFPKPVPALAFARTSFSGSRPKR